MGIRLEQATAQPAVVFDRVHLMKMEITQPVFFNDALQPVYSVSVEYRLYGVDSSGTRHYKGETSEITIDDFLSEAIADMNNGDPTMIMALGGIEKAVATIISNDTNIGSSVV